MSKTRLFFKSRQGRVLIKVVTPGLFLGLSMILLFFIAKDLNDNIFLLGLVIAWLWLLVAIVIINAYFNRHFVAHFDELSEYAKKLSEGKFPAPLGLIECDSRFRNFTLSLNQIRDQLRTNQNLHSVVIQFNNLQKYNRILELKDSIMNNIAQDLRQPLNMIAGYAYLLSIRGTEDNNELLNDLNNFIRFAVVRLERITDLKGLAASTQLPLESSVINTGEFFGTILEYLSKTLEARQISLNIRYATNLPQSIIIDKQRTQQLITIATRILGVDAKPHSELNVVISRSENDIVYSVSDHDPKSQENNLAEIYTHYIEYDAPLNADRDIELGTLGLFFIDTVAPYLNTQLDVAKNSSNGTELRLTFANVVEDSSFAIKGKTHFANSYSNIFKQGRNKLIENSKPNIVIVDSNRDMSKVLGYLLPNANVKLLQEVHEIHNEELEHTDIIICSLIVNSRQSLHDLERECISVAHSGNIPILVILSAPAPELELELKRLGVSGVLTQPLDFAMLKQLLEW